MRLPRRGERGFTLIELLIVVAILGVLAAIVIPNVMRFIGSGEQEARDTELSNIQAAVSAMMVDNKITLLPVAVVWPNATNVMSAFPDATTTLASRADPAPPYNWPAVGNNGYLLYGHTFIVDVNGNGIYDGPPPAGDDELRTVNYVAQDITTSFYTVDDFGTVSQWKNALGDPY